jgi:prolyl-tRNA synthetase
MNGVRIVADDSVTSRVSFVGGANREGYHLTGINYPRDFTADVLTDIAQAQRGHACVHCRAPLEEQRGIEVGHLFKLGTRYSERLGATYLDREGEAQPVVMGSYGIGLGRLLAMVVEQHHDAHGIIWPPSLAPYQVHLLNLGSDEAVTAQAEGLYRDLQGRGSEVLYDDRPESAGVKFNDADLIGLPVRLTVSRRTVEQNAVEWKLRSCEERELVRLDALIGKLRELGAAGKD